jgi:hypothetical protein
MDAITMMKTAAVLLAIAALGGLLMAIIRFKGADRPPSSIAMLHGLLAGSALTLLIYAAVTVGIPTLALIATGLLIIVAIVGVSLNLMYHAKMLPLPKQTVVIHGLVAVVAFVLLLAALINPH